MNHLFDSSNEKTEMTKSSMPKILYLYVKRFFRALTLKHIKIYIIQWPKNLSAHEHKVFEMEEIDPTDGVHGCYSYTSFGGCIVRYALE